MLVIFKSKAAGDIIMYQEHAKPILAVLGKEVQQGVIMPFELAQAVSRLENEIEDSCLHSTEAAQKELRAHPDELDEDKTHESRQNVSFAARAYPLLEMLRLAQQMECEVMWGV
jgi:hypothetical protein